MIDKVIAHTDDGREVTVSDRILASIRAGNYFEPSCKAATIDPRTAWDWRKLAGSALLRELGRDKPHFTKHEARCIEFTSAVEDAEAQWEVMANAQLEQIGRGGQVTTVTTTKYDPQGHVMERTVRETVAEPNAQVLQWRLTRRFPDRYRESIEVRNPAELSIEERARALVENLQDLVDAESAAADGVGGSSPASNGKTSSNGH